MAKKRISILIGVMAVAAVGVVGGWVASSQIESPADMAARAAPPVASPILVPVEERVLSSTVVTRGTARLGLPQPVSIVPSAMKAGVGLIATLPRPNTQLGEGVIALTASGRPVFILQGELPTYRDLSPGIFGDDVRQLQAGLDRLGFAPGPIDGIYDQQTSAAVAKWYQSTGWEPFGPTRDQLAGVRVLEQAWADAQKNKLAANAAAAAAVLAVESARATAERDNRAAAAELAARRAERQRLTALHNKIKPQAVKTARVTAEHGKRAAAAELQDQIANRALIALDPRQPETARKAADARLELARAAARKAELEGEVAVQAAESDTRLAAEQVRLAAKQVELAEVNIKSVRLQGVMAVRSAGDALLIAEFDAKQATARADRSFADLTRARSKLGVHVPADEIVFIPELPVRLKELKVRVGDPATGAVMSVTDNQLVIDASLPLDAAPLVKSGMTVEISEQALGVKATGVVERVADAPGTHGVDGYHIYFMVRVDETPSQLQGYSLRLTMAVQSSGRAVRAVPTSALSLTADGTSRVRVKHNDALDYIVVKPGLSADGYVEVTPVEGTLTAGQMVVVGYNNPGDGARQ